MAKTTNCAFCGKELKKGFWNGEDQLLDTGASTLCCCEDCYNRFNPIAKKHKKRFAIKMDSYRYAARRKPTKAEEAQMYITYIAEAERYQEKQADAVPTATVGAFALVTEDGRFTVTEASNSFMHKDINAKDMAKTITKALEADPNWFTKEDISKIEYAPNDSGSFIGLFHKAYSYTIRLNDEKVMTYRPCITRSSVLGKGFGFGYRKRAEKQLMAELILFKTLIGSDLPITRGSKR